MLDGRCLSCDDTSNNDASYLSSPTKDHHRHHHWVEYPNPLLRQRRYIEGSRRSIILLAVIMMISSMRMNGARQGSLLRKWWVTSLEIPRIPMLSPPRFVPSHGVTTTTTATRSRPPRRRSPLPPSPVSPPTLWQTIDSEDSNIETDSQGRLIRRRATTTNDNDNNYNNNNNNNNNDNSRDNYNNNSKDGWDNFNPLSSSTKSSASPPRYGAGGWVDSSEGWDDNDIRPPPARPTSNRPRNDSFRGSSRGRGDRATGGRRAPFRRDDYSNSNNSNNYNNRNQNRASGRNYDSRDRSGRQNRNQNSNDNYHYTDDDQSKVRMNLRFIEDAGYDHLYGLSSIVHALQANVRFTTRSAATIQKRQGNENDDIPDDQDNWYQVDDNYAMEDDTGTTTSSPNDAPSADIKPEAQVGTFLFVQETYQSNGTGSRRSNDKQQTAQQVMAFAEQYQIPVHYVNKGVLNTMSSNRPHQGYVLRCPKLVVDTHIMSISKIPTDQSDPNYKSFWLVLDEVVDPQNFGAILRSAYFLGAGAETTSSQQPHHHRMGILICSKNSAPPSAVVSATSAGALELFMMQSSSSSSYSSQVYSTNHLIRVLDNAEQDGCRIIGASSSVPYDNVVPLYNLQDIPPLPPPSFESGESPSGPPAATAVTILVLGSEGHGLRPLVAKSCTEYVRIPPAFSTTTPTSRTSAEPLVSSEEDENSSVSSNVDSLNVSVTAGILLWHLLQPRTSTATHTV